MKKRLKRMEYALAFYGSASLALLTRGEMVHWIFMLIAIYNAFKAIQLTVK